MKLVSLAKLSSVSQVEAKEVALKGPVFFFLDFFAFFFKNYIKIIRHLHYKLILYMSFMFCNNGTTIAISHQLVNLPGPSQLVALPFTPLRPWCLLKRSYGVILVLQSIAVYHN